jgi:hypothetical protein
MSGKGNAGGLIFVLLNTFVSAAFADGIRLVTDDELAREREYASRIDTQFVARSVSVPGAPVIEVRNPKLDDTLRTPFQIRISFKAREGAEVVPSTFKVFYGYLKLDITDRVVQKVTVAKEGLIVEEANIPAGSHKLLLQVRDSMDRVGEMTLSFKVEQ